MELEDDKLNQDDSNEDALAKLVQQQLLQEQEKEKALNENVNEVLNDDVNESLNDNKMPDSLENAGFNGNDDFPKDALNGSLNEFDIADSMSDNEEEDWDGIDDFEDDFEEEEPLDESDDNPLDDFIQEPIPTNPVEEVKKATGDSPKNLQNLAELGEMALDLADMWKAQLCSAIGGQYPAEYTSDQKAKKALIAAFKEYLSSQEIKAPTPFATLMIALAMWGLPSFGTAFWHKYQLKKMEKEVSGDKQADTEPLADMQTDVKDYSPLNEFKENRRLFTLHKTKGTYNRTPNGTFSGIDVSEEMPSPEIQELIDQGLKCREIRTIIYGE
jgi:hypothetical protein